MADNQRTFFSGNDRQEEEVRDLFNMLIQQDTGVRPAPTMKETPVEEKIPNVEEAAVAEETLAVEEAPVVEEAAVVEETLTVEEAPIVEEIPAVEEAPVAEELSTVEEPRVFELEEEEPLFAERAKRFFEKPLPLFLHDEEGEDNEYDEQDMLHELPPLVLSPDDEEESEEDDEFVDSHAFVVDDAEQEMERVVAARMRRNPMAVFWKAIRGNVPLPCDSKRVMVRKSLVWLSVLLVVGVLTYILYNVWWLPSFTKKLYADVAKDYRPHLVGTVQAGDKYPAEMQLSFKKLYDRNPEVRGWLTFHAQGNEDFLGMEYPVMYSGDNAKYLSVDFDGNQNKNGALFFDMRAQLNAATDKNDVLIIYGHNMASGQMLAGLNQFIGNVNNARVASTLTMNTLYQNAQYKVFAVIVTDESAAKEQYFDVRRTTFADDADYLRYIDELRARSLFDYPVDVQVGDELLLLSTDTTRSSAKVENGRVTVVARKVRSNEVPSMDTMAIVKNEDVIMPYAWYTAQKKAPHAFYTHGRIPTTSTTTTESMTQTEQTSDWTSQADVTTTTTQVGGTTAKVTTTTKTATTTSGSATTTTTTTATTATTTTEATEATEASGTTTTTTTSAPEEEQQPDTPSES